MHCVNPPKRYLGRLKIPFYAIFGVSFLIILFTLLWRPLNPARISYVPLKKNSTITEAKLRAYRGNALLDQVEPRPIGTDTESMDQPASEDEIVKDELDRAFENKSQELTYYMIEKGDTLLGVLSQFDVNRADIYLLTEQYKQLANLRIGQRVSWVVDKNKNLRTFTWYVSSRNIRVYEREGNKYNEYIEKREGSWKPLVFSGQIGANFLADAKNAGLTLNEIAIITKALQWQLDFRRLQKGDLFAVYLQREIIGNRHESSELLAVRIKNVNRDYYAILADDGNYYDNRGAGLARSFLRYPLEKAARISSTFNPRRLNPVTRRITPHNGVDFAVSRGTNVLASGDGEVGIAKYSGSAGNFVAIRHGRQYTSRYMHLDKILVKPGQHVKKGQIIARSGNTGRSTGPHLHYELLIDNKPVNPMTVSLPQSASLTGKSKAAYLELIKTIKPKLAFATDS